MGIPLTHLVHKFIKTPNFMTRARPVVRRTVAWTPYEHVELAQPFKRSSRWCSWESAAQIASPHLPPSAHECAAGAAHELPRLAFGAGRSGALSIPFRGGWHQSKGATSVAGLIEVALPLHLLQGTSRSNNFGCKRPRYRDRFQSMSDAKKERSAARGHV